MHPEGDCEITEDFGTFVFSVCSNPDYRAGECACDPALEAIGLVANLNEFSRLHDVEMIYTRWAFLGILGYVHPELFVKHTGANHGQWGLREVVGSYFPLKIPQLKTPDWEANAKMWSMEADGRIPEVVELHDEIYKMRTQIFHMKQELQEWEEWFSQSRQPADCWPEEEEGWWEEPQERWKNEDDSQDQAWWEEEETPVQEPYMEDEMEDIWEEEKEFWKIEEQDPKSMIILEVEVIHARWVMLGTLGITRPNLLASYSGGETGQVAAFKQVGSLFIASDLDFWGYAGLIQSLPLVTIIGYQVLL